jgi:glycosyltransferase involved in cell wall biosynthesis
MEITVITPSFNSERFIEQTMQSVALQRSDSLSVEHLIIDGGSKDSTAKIVEQFAHSDTRFISERDNGPADAINKGFALAKGKYISWLNSDDFYMPGALKRAVEVLEKKSSKAFCFGHCPIVDENGREIRKRITSFKEFWYPLSCRPLIRTLNYISQPAMIIRRAALEKAGPLRTDLKAAWDYDFTLRLWRYGGAVRVQPPALASFRWTPQSISGSNYKLQFTEELDCAISDAGKFAPTAVIHRFVAWGIVFCYDKMSSTESEK